jgi:hypothetical protein
MSEIPEDEKRFLSKRSDLLVKTVEFEELTQYYEDNKFSMTDEQLQDHEDRIALLQVELTTLNKQVDAELNSQLDVLSKAIGKDKDKAN